jgi:hypothetical protein
MLNKSCPHYSFTDIDTGFSLKTTEIPIGVSSLKTNEEGRLSISFSDANGKEVTLDNITLDESAEALSAAGYKLVIPAQKD